MRSLRLIVVQAALAGSLPVAGFAAGPAQNDFLKQPMMAEATIRSSPLVRKTMAGVDGYTPAPVPDLYRDVPVAAPVDPNAPHVAPRLFHKQTTYHGEGYVFGSTVQEQQDRRVQPAPGINLIMPLQ